MGETTMRQNRLIYTVAVFSLFSLGRAGESPGSAECPLIADHQDNFLDILSHYNVSGSRVLPVEDLTDFVVALAKRVRCDGVRNPSSSCTASICFSTEGLVTMIGSNASSGLEEDAFGAACSVLLYYFMNLQDYCQNTVVFNETLDFYRSELVAFFTSNSTIQSSRVQTVLGNLNASLIFEDSGDVGDGVHEEEEEEEEHGHHIHSLVHREKCLSGGLVFDRLGVDPEETLSLGQLDEVATVVLYQLFEGAAIFEDCRLLPRPSYFLDELFEHQTTLTESQFSDIVTGILTPSAPEVEGDAHLHRRRKREVGDSHHEEWTKCFMTDDFLAIYGVEEGAGISKERFTQICPGLVQTKLSGACQAVTETADQAPSTLTEAERYGYATLATVIICLCSLVGVATIPFAKLSLFEGLLDFFRGLAIGTLAGDSLLHLIPEALGLHGHGEEDHGLEHDSGVVMESYVGFGLVMLAGIYVFFLMELIMSISGHGHSHEEPDEQLTADVPPATTLSFQNGALTDSKGDLYAVQTTSVEAGSDPPKKKSRKRNGLKAIALMVLLGDGLHNFVDGLAIGAAFTSGATEGIATSITVFCHEFPHEFGDFAVLISSGLSIPRALFFNFVSSIIAMIGLYVGLAVTTDEMTSRWIFSFTAGLFLYIALVNLIPDVIRRSSKGDKRCVTIVTSNIGMFLGVGIMIILSLFEEKISLSL